MKDTLISPISKKVKRKPRPITPINRWESAQTGIRSCRAIIAAEAFDFFGDCQVMLVAGNSMLNSSVHSGYRSDAWGTLLISYSVCKSFLARARRRERG